VQGLLTAITEHYLTLQCTDVPMHAVDSRLSQHTNPPLFELTLYQAGHVLILDRHDLFGHFDQRDLAAQIAVQAGELYANGPGADHQQ